MSFLFEKARGSIQVLWLKNKPRGLRFARDAALISAAFCIAVLSYGASKIESEREVRCPVSIKNTLPVVPLKDSGPKVGTDDGNPAERSADNAITSPGGLKNSDALPGAGGRVVASKNGTKYHYPWCAGASQIKEENKIWYESELQAQQAGLTKAKNCQ